ncbi:MAG: Dkf-1p, partial [Paramarteilia canceri]
KIDLKNIERLQKFPENNENIFSIESPERRIYILKKSESEKPVLDMWYNMISEKITPMKVENPLRSSTCVKTKQSFDSCFTINTKKILGSGNFGTVYEGIDNSTKKTVAMKVIKINKTDLSDLEKEYSLMVNLEHPGIVKMLNMTVNNREKYCCIIMELCGSDLLDFILETNNGSLHYRLCKFYGYQVLHGLVYLHKKMIIHSDMKPENLLLSPDVNKDQLFGLLKISDFGLSRILEPKQMRSTIVGSPNYIAPEVSILRKFDMKADVWAMAVVFYVMLKGEFPFSQNEKNHEAKIKESKFYMMADGDKFPQEYARFLGHLFTRAETRPRSYELITHPLWKANWEELAIDIYNLNIKHNISNNYLKRVGDDVDVMEYFRTKKRHTSPWTLS